MIEELIQRAFSARDAAHMAHFRTKSYAQHVALGDFYESVIGAVDDLVETHQGLFGIVDNITPKPRKGDVIGILRDDADWIEANRDLIAGGSDAVAHLVDGITALYLKTLYKLENLK